VSGHCCTSTTAAAACGYDQRIEAFGRPGCCTRAIRRATSVLPGAPSTPACDPILHFFLERYRQAYESELNAFVAALEEGRPMTQDFSDGLAALQLASSRREHAHRLGGGPAGGRAAAAASQGAPTPTTGSATTAATMIAPLTISW
jgi:myo-inositol 2-dehydrogenase/D-chiro-inositol 1-dehydrogenase